MEVSNKIKHAIMYISFQERQKRDLMKYEEEKSRYIKMSQDEQDLKYINLKARYEHKKNILLAFIVTIIVAIFTGVWKVFHGFLEKALEYIQLTKDMSVEYTEIAIIVFSVITIMLSIFLFGLIVLHINNIRKLYKELLIIENIRHSNI